MTHILLLGAGFSRNWGAPLANEITGSLLGELHDDTVLAGRLRSGPFEDAFAGFQRPRGGDEDSRRVRRLQAAVTGLFARMMPIPAISISRHAPRATLLAIARNA